MLETKNQLKNTTMKKIMLLLVAALCIMPTTAAKKSKKIDFNAEAAAVYDQMVEFRRDLHMYPELGADLPRSCGKITEILDKAGIPYIVDSQMNIIGLIEGGKPGKTLAMRADYDALPIQEETGFEYSSKIPGVMHACGHDIHAASLLGAALILKKHQAELPGKVYLCFQSAEETGGGSATMIVDYIKSQGGADGAVAFHTYGMNIPHGTYAIRSGKCLAGSIFWKMIVRGKSGHGSSPWLSIDPIKPAAEIVLRITAMQSTMFDTNEPFVVSPCMFNTSSKAGNIIPEEVTIEGSIRYFTPEHMTAVPERIGKIANDVAASYGATVEFLPGIDGSNKPTINSPEAADRATRVVKGLGKEVVEKVVEMGSDDFSEFLYAFGGIYIFTGIKMPDQPLNPHHASKFNPDERSIEDNIAVFCAYAFDHNAEN